MWSKTFKCKTKLPKLKTVMEGRKVACNRGGILVLLEGVNINKTYHFKREKIKACDGLQHKNSLRRSCCFDG